MAGYVYFSLFLESSSLARVRVALRSGPPQEFISSQFMPLPLLRFFFVLQPGLAGTSFNIRRTRTRFSALLRYPPLKVNRLSGLEPLLTLHPLSFLPFLLPSPSSSHPRDI